LAESHKPRRAAARGLPFLPLLAVAGAGAFVGLYLTAAGPRLLYPYDLDFIEGGLLLQAWQHALGRPVFAAPTAEFAPTVYMPLYMWLGGLLLRVTGLSYLPLRLLSFAATLGTAALIGWIAHRESRLSWLGLASAGLYLGGYRLSGFWYELARVDSFYVFLTLSGLALGVYAGGTRRGAAAAAGLLALAFFTKQTAVVTALGLAFALWRMRRPAAAFGVTFAAAAALPYLALDALSSGWFSYHVVGVVASNPVELGRVVRYLGAELLGGMGALSAAALTALWLTGRGPDRPRGFARQPWFAGLAAAALVSGLGRAPIGGNLNNLMPVYALLCLAPALLIRAAPAGQRRWPALAAGLILAQLALGVYNPLRYTPTPAMRAAGDALIARLRAEPGDALVLMHPYYALLAGKPQSVHVIHVWYFYKNRGLALPADWVRRLETRRYGVIISDESLFETEPALRALLERYYAVAEGLPEAESPPTNTGVVVRPQLLWRPRP